MTKNYCKDEKSDHGINEMEQIHKALNEHAIVSTTDVKGNITAVNKKFCEISGYSEKELLGKNHRILNSDTHNDAFFIDMWQTITSAKTWHGNICNKRKDGQLYWVESSITPVLDSNRNIIKYISIRTDITYIKGLELELRKSESRFENAQRMVRMGNWEWDLKTNSVYWSDEMYEIYGCDKEIPIENHENVNKFIHTDDIDKVKSYEETIKSGFKERLSYRVIRNDRTLRYIMQHAEIKYDSNNEPAVMLGAIHDITEQVELEYKLSHQKAIFESMFRDAQDAMVMADTDRKIVMINPAFSKLFGYGQDEVVGRTSQFLYKNEEEYKQQGDKRFNNNTDAEYKNTGYEIEYRQKNGDTFISNTIGSILKETNGNTIGFLGNIRDITRKIQDKQLIIASKEEAEKANKAKSEFLSSMSHELRTPMNAILGFSQLLEMDYENNLSDEQKADVKEIKNAGEHLLELINEVLDLSKIESGGINIVLEDIDYLELVMECVSIIKPIAKKRNIKINITDEDIYSNNKLSLNADRTRLRQVLLNLLSNSVKYNKPNESIDIYCEKIKDDVVRISIVDHGIGITEQNLQKIFTPFQRFVDDDSAIEGTGIGLVISKRLIELMGGNIGVTSELGKGSTFWFEITLNYVPKIIKKIVTPLNKSESDKSCGDFTIVYIEDNPANLRLVSKLLSKREKIMLITAPNPEIGLELINVHLPQLILLDINLPGMNGYQVLSEIKNNDKTVNIPVVAISANAMQSEIDHAYKLGFVEYLTKPLNLSYFYEVIDKFRIKNDVL